MVLNNRIIWDFRDFVSLVTRPAIIIDEADMEPYIYEGNANVVTLGQFKFNVCSTIYSAARANEVILGWRALNRIVPLDRLIPPFFTRATNEFKILQSEFF
jgi:hypothetical protein